MTDTAAARLALGPLAAVVEVLCDGVAVLDGRGTLTYLNPAGARLLNRRADELVGRTFLAALPDADGLADFLAHARNAGAPVIWRGRVARDGAWLSATAVAAGDLLQLTFRKPDGQWTSGRPRTDRPTDDVLGAGETADASGADAERERLAYLAVVTETMIGTLDTGEAATRLAELAVKRLCDWAVVVVTGDDGRPRQEGRAHRDPARRADVDTYRDGRRQVTSHTTPIAAALHTGKPVRLARIDETQIAPTLATEAVRAAWRRLATTSAAIVPLRAHGETIGVLAMMSAGTRPPQTEAEIATSVEVARRGALALDNARLYGRQLNVAETLQRSLLSPPPQTHPDQLHIAVRYRPAASYQAVGGDWYDAFPQPDGATMLVIGDVAGHTVEATAAMSQIRSMLRALAHDRPGSPAQTLGRLDGALTGLRVNTMATALLARIEQTADQAREGLRTLRWSSAGHVPPLLLHVDGRVRVLDRPPERLLGTGWTGRRHDHEIRLHPGDTVLLVTDGLVEHGRCDLDRGMARLAAALAQCADLPVEELCDRLIDRIVPGRADDDIALLALRCHPQPPAPAPTDSTTTHAPASSYAG